MRIFISLVIILLFGGVARAQISVIAEVDHVKPDGVDTAGNIVLNVSGGTGPYTYEWQPGTYTAKDYTNIAIGTYTVKVKDSTPDSVYYYYRLGYKTHWSDLYGSRFSNDSLIPDYSEPGWGSATSVNTLKSGHDGWLEYVVKSTSSYEMVGFADSLTLFPGTYSDVDYGFYNNGGLLYHVEYGYLYFYGYCYAGDVFHIERNDTLINLYVNNTYYGYDVVPVSMRSNDWKIHAILDNASMTNVGCSFPDSTNSLYPAYIQDVPQITHCTPGFSNGNISLTPRYGGPHTYSWSPGGSTSSTITGLAPGAYHVGIKDADNNESDYVYNVGYKPRWKNLYGCTYGNDSIHPGGSPTGWSTALSVNTLKSGNDGWLEYIIKSNTGYEMLGFLDSNSVLVGMYSDVDYGLYFSANIIYYNEGGYLSYASSCRIGDLIRVERKDTIMNYLQNGALLGSSVVPLSMRSRDWKVKAIIDNENVYDVGLSFCDSSNVQFPMYVQDYRAVIPNAYPGMQTGAILLNAKNTSVNKYSCLVGGVPDTLLAGEPAGNYKVTSKDYLNNSSTYNYRIGYLNSWTDLDGFVYSHDTLYSTSSTSGYATATSADSLPPGEDGWTDFVCRLSDVNTAGFIDSTSVPEQLYDIDFGLYQSNNYLYAIVHGSFYYMAVVDEGDIASVERTDTLINFKVNGSTLLTETENSSAYRKIKVSSYTGSRTINVNSNISLTRAVSTQYLTLKKTLDGGFYVVNSNKLYFTYDGEYNSTNLSYSIYDNMHSLVSSCNSLVKVKGDNRFVIDLLACSSASIFKYYILEVANEKNEKYYLRFLLF